MNPLGKGVHVKGHHSKRYYEGICEFCGEVFLSARKGTRFCPEPKTCYNKSWQEKKRREAGAKKRKQYDVEKWNFKTVYPHKGDNYERPIKD